MGFALTQREFWMMFHLGVGALFLHGFVDGLRGLYNSERFGHMVYGAWGMTIAAWLTVISGTWIIYPWYRANPPQGSNIDAFPRSYLLANQAVSEWHHFGMEWKEHVGWITPILGTAVAYIVIRYGRQLSRYADIRRAAVVLFVVAFASAFVAGALGALINKVAPNLFLDV